VITGEAWVTDQFNKYKGLSAGIGGIGGSLGPDALSGAGFPMRSIMRSDLFAGQEIETVVTSIAEVPAPSGAFDVPAGYKEVPPQIGMPPMGRGR